MACSSFADSANWACSSAEVRDNKDKSDAKGWRHFVTEVRDVISGVMRASRLAGAGGEAGARHALAQTTFLQKILLQAA
jgi:hypothetical protein